MHPSLLPRVRAVLVLFVICLASASQAFNLFGDGKGRALRRMRQADETMARADSTFAGGNKDQALTLYRRAVADYSEVLDRYPDLEEGLPRFRLAYCQSQIALITGEPVAGATNTAAAIAPTNNPVRAAAPVPAAAPPPPPPAATNRTAMPPTPVEEFPAAGTAALATQLAEARSLMDADQLDAASKVLVNALKDDPSSRPVRLMIAMVRCRQSRFDEALAALEDLRAAQEDLPLLLTLAAAYQGKGQSFNAMLALDKAIRLQPSHPHAYVNMAWLRLSMVPGEAGRAEAEQYYRKAVKLGGRRDWQLERRLGIE